ncbi:MAG: hypothetical protein IPO88_11030 [Nannocystis sp.]|uniref:hypothetical protein n=1 Tax=Nannocystis sp. TaxID=1962667 RepID=UPI002428B50C|nr:hypothetical protein [Nannocystis sp.]MBK9754020.1 hypothetical protein [Nannocystis sp.]
MAVLSNVTLSIAKIPSTPTSVRVTIKYRLTPSRVEQMARSVFNEEVSLLGRDWLTLPMEVPAAREGSLAVPTIDTPIATLGGSSFAVGESMPHVDRSRVFVISKSRLNEDPETTASGSEVQDELLARVKVSYAANKPTGASAPYPAFSAMLTGTWV